MAFNYRKYPLSMYPFHSVQVLLDTHGSAENLLTVTE